MRLAALQGSILVVVLGVVAAALVWSFSNSYEAVAARSLGDELHSFAAAAADRPARQSLERFSAAYLRSHSLAADGAALVALRGGTRVETSDAVGLAHSPVVVGLLRRAAPVERHTTSASASAPQAQATTIGGRAVELASATLVEGARPVGTIVATADLAPFALERSRVLELSIAEAAVALVAGVASSYVLLRKLLRTVGRITSAADDLGRSNLDRRLGDQGSDDEVGDLARTFDEMLDRIASAMSAQRRLLADVSHQLRTPITVARGHLEVLGRTGTTDPEGVGETIDLVVDELGHMGAVVERLLMLGHAMDPDFLAREPVDLRALLADCAASGRVIGPRGFVLGAVPDVVIVADGQKLRGAVLNLLDNAVHATTTGDLLRLGATHNPERAEVELVVEDSGPGIPAEQRELALQRFARPGARTTGGTGLGLAIVRAVAEAHGGHVTIGDSDLGGARVAIVLPTQREQHGERDRREGRDRRGERG